MQAEIKNIPYIYCPNCGGGQGWRVEHILESEGSRSFGPWPCKNCEHEFFGRKTEDGIEITEIRLCPSRRKLSLLRFRDLYVVVDSYGPYLKNSEEPPDWYDYLFHSHQCPENIMRSVIGVFCPSEGSDPHGIFRFIAAVDDNNETRKELENITSLGHLFRFFDTDGQEAPTRWPESERGLVSGLARLQDTYQKTKSPKA